MKNYPYIRYFLVLLTFIPMLVLNLIFNFIFFWTGTTNAIRKHKIFFLVWFINTDEKDDTANNYGDLEHREEWGIVGIEDRNIFTRFWWFINWNVIRNSFFYYRQHVIAPKAVPSTLVKVKKNTTGKDPLHICNINDRGWIHIIEERKGTKYFRLSGTHKFWFVIPLWWNHQYGVNGFNESNRHLIDWKFKRRN